MNDDVVQCRRKQVVMQSPGDELGEPHQYLKLFFFHTDVFELMVECTNTFSVRKSERRNCLNVTVMEMEIFIGI